MRVRMQRKEGDGTRSLAALTASPALSCATGRVSASLTSGSATQKRLVGIDPPCRARLSINSIDISPRGFDYGTSEVDKEIMTEWRRRYKALPPARQMMVATTVTLYRREPDKTCLSRMPDTWHAADAVAV